MNDRTWCWKLNVYVTMLSLTHCLFTLLNVSISLGIIFFKMMYLIQAPSNPRCLWDHRRMSVIVQQSYLRLLLVVYPIISCCFIGILYWIYSYPGLFTGPSLVCCPLAGLKCYHVIILLTGGAEPIAVSASRVWFIITGPPSGFVCQDISVLWKPRCALID